MDFNAFLLIVLVLLMLGCCGKMLYMGLRKRDTKTAERSSVSSAPIATPGRSDEEDHHG